MNIQSAVGWLGASFSNNLPDSNHCGVLVLLLAFIVRRVISTSVFEAMATSTISGVVAPNSNTVVGPITAVEVKLGVSIDVAPDGAMGIDPFAALVTVGDFKLLLVIVKASIVE